ncbi:MAG TPA: ribonuclease J [Dehalococcoidia bacterium]|nr:ribonuclease J [Dehalococcoidia bacterium]
MPQPTLRVIPLGGLGEIGKNMMAIECGDDIVVVDCGLMFPEEEMLGVDLVIPDISYLLEHREKLRGILITHGHEDHIGALPYLLPSLRAPVYSTRLTHGLIAVRLKERRALDGAELHIVEPGQEVVLGGIRAEFFRVAHSIPDATGIALHTPAGTVVHTGDFKFDHTPVDGRPTDLAKLAQLGSEGVLLLLSDSTYAEVPGYTQSEQVVGDALHRIIGEAPGRVVVACFASLISRVQQVIDAAIAWNRKVLVVGRSMQDNVNMAQELGYLYAPENLLIGPEELRRLPPNKVVVVATGSQGEPTSALARMANRDHRFIRIQAGDTVVLSASPIPGNEELVARTVDNLFRLGARVLYSQIAQVHVHGHGAQEELKLMLSLVRPQYFVPVHGEYRHLVHHRELAKAVGVAERNCFLLVDGDVLEIGEGGGEIVGKVPADYVYVDGLGDVGTEVLRDRKRLSQDGILVVILAVDQDTGALASRPEIVQRGFIEPGESEALLERAKDLIQQTVFKGETVKVEWSVLSTTVRETVGKFLYDQTRRRPLILPVTIEV